MIRSFLAFSVLALSCVGAAHAQRISPMPAGRFAQICSKPAGKGICDAYISGMADGGALSRLNARSEGDNAAVPGFCVPDGETTDAMRGKVLSWLKSHPDVLKAPVGKSVFAALHDSYTCSSSGGQQG